MDKRAYSQLNSYHRVRKFKIMRSGRQALFSVSR